jgi:hypothetical protein
VAPSVFESAFIPSNDRWSIDVQRWESRTALCHLLINRAAVVLQVGNSEQACTCLRAICVSNSLSVQSADQVPGICTCYLEEGVGELFCLAYRMESQRPGEMQ